MPLKRAAVQEAKARKDMHHSQKNMKINVKLEPGKTCRHAALTRQGVIVSDSPQNGRVVAEHDFREKLHSIILLILLYLLHHLLVDIYIYTRSRLEVPRSSEEPLVLSIYIEACYIVFFWHTEGGDGGWCFCF